MIDDPKKLHRDVAHNPASLSIEAAGVRTVSSQELFAGQREILITHEEKVYRLRITNQNKLVLNL